MERLQLLNEMDIQLNEMGKEVYCELDQQLKDFQRYNFMKNGMIYNIFTFNII